MKISELVKELLEHQKAHGDLDVWSDDEEVKGVTYYPDDDPPFVYLET